MVDNYSVIWFFSIFSPIVIFLGPFILIWWVVWFRSLSPKMYESSGIKPYFYTTLRDQWVMLSFARHEILFKNFPDHNFVWIITLYWLIVRLNWERAKRSTTTNFVNFCEFRIKLTLRVPVGQSGQKWCHLSRVILGIRMTPIIAGPFFITYSFKHVKDQINLLSLSQTCDKGCS